jgi:hypothetical protein
VLHSKEEAHMELRWSKRLTWRWRLTWSMRLPRRTTVRRRRRVQDRGRPAAGQLQVSWILFLIIFIFV